MERWVDVQSLILLNEGTGYTCERGEGGSIIDLVFSSIEKEGGRMGVGGECGIRVGSQANLDKVRCWTRGAGDSESSCGERVEL